MAKDYFSEFYVFSNDFYEVRATNKWLSSMKIKIMTMKCKNSNSMMSFVIFEIYFLICLLHNVCSLGQRY